MEEEEAVARKKWLERKYDVVVLLSKIEKIWSGTSEEFGSFEKSGKVKTKEPNKRVSRNFWNWE